MATPLLPAQHQVPPQQQTRKLGTSSRKKMPRISVIQAAVLCAVSSVVAFYLGMVLGSSAAASSNSSQGASTHDCFTSAQVQQKVMKALSDEIKSNGGGGPNRDTSPRFPKGMDQLVAGMAYVDRDDFNHKFDLGVPYDPSTPQNDKVLMLYSTQNAFPDSDPFKRTEAMSQTALPSVSAEEGTANCDYLHIILQETKNRRQCTAIVGQYEAFHIQKFMRLPEAKGPLNPSLPLRLVNRGAQSTGRKSLAPPPLESSRVYWKTLQSYLGHLDEILETLKPIVEKAAKEHTVIVQVCNFGQSELLLNFLCSTRRRGLDTSNIIVFATDQETHDLLNAMGGVSVVYDKEIFEDMPERAARSYGDVTFMKMMMAKIYCVQLISLLGYDVLFQDVDVVWYKNPLHYFHNKNASDANFDIYFQDDGNHALFYAPYSANTGFYYVRNNDRTRYFFNSLLMAGDLVIQSRSHQIPLVALLQEHASMYGLKIKIFSRDEDQFPGGHAFHRRKSLLKDMLEGKAHPEIFHMSWTNNKVNKVKFYQQMGEWYLQDTCQSKKLNEIVFHEQPQDMVSECCWPEPKIVCHYKDKPSKIPCNDSPPIDKYGRSWW